MHKIRPLLVTFLLILFIACGNDETPPSPDANLDSLTTSAGTLSPSFDPATTAYSLSLPNTVASITVEGIAADNSAVVSYEPAQPASLTMGSNLIRVRVVSADGSTTNFYQLVVHRAESDNADLDDLLVNAGSLTPAFNPAIKLYTVNLSNTVNSITVKGIAANTGAVVSCDPAQPASLTVGSNLIRVRVVSADGSATNTYQLVVHRAESDNADLATLSVDAGSLIPAFDPAITDYSVSYISNSVASASLTATASNGGASLSYPYGQSISLAGGSNQLVVRVTAADGTSMKDYTIRIYRMETEHTSPTIGTLVYVPAGSFRRDASGANISFVSAFRMSRTEITRSQYSNVMGADPANISCTSSTADPVQTVNWYHAIAFCNKLSIAEGWTPVYTVTGINFTNLNHADVPEAFNTNWNAVNADWNADGYRLPTEMEWMWAAMGAQTGSDPFSANTNGHASPFAGSDGSNSADDYAWHAGNSSSSTHPAGNRTPNALGLTDMSGNVWEWCWDVNDDYPGGHLSDYRGPDSGSWRTRRGGSWYYSSTGCAIAFRFSLNPNGRDATIGFRVVRP